MPLKKTLLILDRPQLDEVSGRTEGYKPNQRAGMSTVVRAGVQLVADLLERDPSEAHELLRRCDRESLD